MQKKFKKKFSEKTYSLIGKISLESFPIILQKDRIIKGETKKLKIRDLFHPDQPKEEKKTIDDYNTFSNYKVSISKNNDTGKYSSKPEVDLYFDEMKTNPKFFYHNKHLSLLDKLKKIYFEVDSFTYAPKYDFVKPRALTGPNWEYVMERKYPKIVYDERDFYLKHDDVLKNTDYKCLVNMNKTTQRIEFVQHKNIKFKNDKKYVSKFNKKKKSKNKYKNKIPFTSRNKELSDKKYKLFNFKTLSNEKNHKKLTKKNHSVDFKKIISREEVDRVKDPRFYKIPFITPNYTLVEERLISTIPFSKEKDKSSNNKNKKNIEGYDFKINYSPDKYISKINNHLEPQTPNFSHMFHRAGNWKTNTKKNPLPFYMRDIYDRNSVGIMTQKSLEQNNFKDGKIYPLSSSFLPKQSFNRVININLINSKTFKEKTNDDYIEEKKEFLKENISLKNKKSEIKELKNSGALDKFENFTYKAKDKRVIIKNDSMKNIFNSVY